MISTDLTRNIGNKKVGLNPSLGVPWTSRGIVQGESDLCQVVTLVTSHQGTGTPAGDPQFLKIRANQVAPSMFI